MNLKSTGETKSIIVEVFSPKSKEFNLDVYLSTFT